jgi:hypothetical protein
MIPALEKEAQRVHAWGYFAYYTSCPPLLGVDNVWKSRWHECREFNDAMMKMAVDLDIENIILAAVWSAYPTGRIQTTGSWQRGVGASRESFAQGLNRTIRTLSNSGRQIWIVEQAPWMGFDVPRALALRGKFALKPGDMQLAYPDHVARQQFVHGLFVDALSIQNVHRIDPALVLCNEVSCQVEADGKSLYLDDDHLSDFGSQWISEVFRPVFGSVPAVPKN